jgi:hypothetical protein
VRDVVPAATASAIAAGAALLVHMQLDVAPAAPALADVIVSSVVGLVAYALALRALFTRTFESCAAVLTALKPRRLGRSAV